MLPSYCSECDAPPGGCDHTAPRYLDPIVYEHVADEHGKHVGWNIPLEEQGRWDAPQPKPQRRPAGREPKPIQRLITELEAWMFLDQDLETRIRALHETEPLRTTLLAEHLIKLAEAGKLDNPAGLLSVRITELATKP